MFVMKWEWQRRTILKKKIDIIMDVNKLEFTDIIKKYFPNYNYNICIEPERLDYRRLDNLVGDQQRTFLIFWAVQMCGKTGLSGIEFGAGGLFEPYVINTDKYPCGAHMLIDAESDRDLEQFKNGEFNLVLASHVIEHLSVNIETLFRRHWLRILKPNGIIAGIIPDEQFGNTMAYDPTHKQHWISHEFKALLQRLDDIAEIIEIDTLNNHFSFNFVLRKR